jgi:hypothetical protein
LAAIGTFLFSEPPADPHRDRVPAGAHLPLHANGMATPAHPGVAYLVPRGGDLHLVKLVADAGELVDGLSRAAAA